MYPDNLRDRTVRIFKLRDGWSLRLLDLLVLHTLLLLNQVTLVEEQRQRTLKA